MHRVNPAAAPSATAPPGNLPRLLAKEHALKVVETNALVLDRIEDRVRGLSWDEIAAQEEAIHRDLRALDEPIAQITSLHLVRPDGRVVVLSTTS